MTSAYYKRYLASLRPENESADETLHVLSEKERSRIDFIYWRTLAIAALFSVGGFLAYYLPVYAWEKEFFVADTITVGTYSLKYGFRELLWGIVLMILEIHLLTLLNLHAIHQTAAAAGFINANNATASPELELLARIGLEDPFKEVSSLGLNPHQGLSRFSLGLFFLFQKLKGWAGNKLLRYLFSRIMGRYAVRYVLDFVGMPMYMALNAWGSSKVLKATRVILLGGYVVERFVAQLPKDIAGFGASEKQLIYDTLQYIAISKRDYHYNHFLLAQKTLHHFRIATEPEHLLPSDYLERLQTAPEAIQKLSYELILLGFILDGHFSASERLRLVKLKDQAGFPYSAEEINARAQKLLRGEA